MERGASLEDLEARIHVTLGPGNAALGGIAPTTTVEGVPIRRKTRGQAGGSCHNGSTTTVTSAGMLV